MYFKDDDPEVPTDPIDRVLQLQSIMIDRVTYFRGGPEAGRLYVALRASLMRDDALRTRLPQAVRVCRMLDDLWDFIQAKRRMVTSDEVTCPDTSTREHPLP